MTTEAAPRAPIAVSVDCSGRVNFAFQQNAIPVIRRVEIRNESPEDLLDVVCRFAPKPEWAKPFERTIARIPGKSDFALTDIPVELSLEYLAALSDRVRGAIALEVFGRREGQGEATLLHSSTLPIEVFAFDEWTGLETLPEILAAFVTPNVAAVERLLSRAADFLGQRSESSSIDGYQSKSKKRVYQILDALFDAVREQGIRYSNPPASFESAGQRVRFGEQMLRSNLATCLDLSLLFAGAIEAAGLRPLVLMHQGHAYVGCWLVEDSFAEPSRDDLQSIRKRVELDEIVVFESTLCCEGSAGDFTHAVAAARQHLGKDPIFQYAIDIHRARASGIRPLPIGRGDGGIDVEAAARAAKTIPLAGASRAGEREFAPDILYDALPKTPEGRIDRWKQQLLDLTLRNRLLNFRETKQSIPLVCPHPEKLEDELAASQAFKVLEQTKLMAGLDPRSAALQERQFAQDPLTEHLVEELRARRLRSSLGEAELSRRLLELYRRARAELDESGANTLYLAVGFLEWKETQRSDRSQRAPILLIPVRLDRKSVRHGFSIQRIDEDAMVNVTLLELLKRDFDMDVPGVNPPPEDELGVDVSKVFLLFQQAVKDLPGWEVHREVWLAQFSFSKFLLWKDLHDRIGSLTENRLVAHLVDRPGEPFVDEVESVEPSELDDALGCNEVFCPVSADSSQLAAVVAASRGKNFVMRGPPGTGKSQTITNLIAHCLAMGKRVLFVAEKRAALEVVHKRLAQIGLGPFCLELHSNKTGKADILRQFGESLDFGYEKTPEEWERVASQLGKARDELNVFVRALHQPYPNGLTAYDCYAWLIAHRDREPALSGAKALKLEGIEAQSKTRYEELLALCDDLQIRGSERRLSQEAKDALRPFACSRWTPEWEESALEAAAALREQARAFAEAFASAGAALGFGEAREGSDFIDSCVGLGQLLVDAPTVPADFADGSGWAAFRDRARAWIETGRRRDGARTALAGFDLGAVLAFDVDPFAKRLAALSEKSGVWNAFQKWRLLKPVRAMRAPSADAWKPQDAPRFVENARALQAAQAALEVANGEAARRLGAHWKAGEGNWDELEGILSFGDELHAAIAQVAGEDVALLAGLREKIGELLPFAADMLADGKPVAAKIETLAAARRTLSAREAEFARIAVVDTSVALAARGYLEGLSELVERFTAFRGDLQNWCRWQASYQSAVAAGLAPLLEAVERGALPLPDLRFAFEKRYRECFLKRLISLSEPLREFWGDEHEKRIEAFSALDERYTKLAAQAVIARLAAELPRARGEDCPRNTELGILQRERAKKARHKPARRLFSEIPNIASKLKPCFLMSPLSVAQYLDVDQENFDIVVFDEASQIPTWDAVGAIARGKQVIVVGDPKQLPPTNFFGRAEADEDAIDDGSVQDLESILDECLGSGLQTYDLRWHYRSRREGLIAFSNHHYYENRLRTFPSPHSEYIGVRLVAVPDGFYDKGKTRTNPAEAEAIKAEVARRLLDPVLSRESLGIVTFSQAQQTLVMDKLDEARREHPEIEAFFGDDAEEPVFVKNLENVQGDERDVIIFSICYGPEQSGKVSMNFGPLNRGGGERRLNVAVTRAKREIVVFSTLRSDQIDLSKTRAKGAEHLKSYLEYAERGARSLGGSIASEKRQPADPLFEKQVADLLAKNGYEVHSRVGCSEYRIDLAVVAPSAPGHYALGIECDGASYRQAATARDRDCLRRSVLEGLGWRIRRVWSTDWWRDPVRAGEDLLRAVAEAVEGFALDAAPPLVAAVPEPLPASATEAVEEDPIRYASQASASALAATGHAAPYPLVDTQIQPIQEEFYDPASAWRIRSQIVRIVEAEGPIVESLLTRRVAEEWRFGRAGGRIQDIIARCFPSALAKSMQGEQRVFWPQGVEPDGYAAYRVPNGQPQSQRAIEEIPQEELRNAALDALERYVSVPRDDLRREVARQFGIVRLTQNIGSHLDRALAALAERGKARESDGVVTLAE